MMRNNANGAVIPSFSSQDINGKTITDSYLRGKVAVVYTWAEWSYESRNMRDRLLRLKSEYGNRVALMGISLDASKRACSMSLRNDSTGSAAICDQLMFESPLLETFGLGRVSDNIVYNAQGRIVERGLNLNELETKLKVLLN